MDAALITARQNRGLQLAQGKKSAFRKIADDTYLVPSAATAGSVYVVNVTTARCTCPDYETFREPCKHIWACRYRYEVTMPDGSTTVVTETRYSYPQKWSAYNAAQVAEKDVSQALLRQLCDTVVTPPHPGRGPKSIPYSDALFACAWKVYSTWSCRRASSDIRAAREAGLIERQPSYNAIFDYMAKPEVTPILKYLVELSATPMRAVEREFAPDATGFATPSYVRWFDYRHGEDRRTQRWLKASAMCGTLTNVITAVEVTEKDVHDSKLFKPMLDTTVANGFTVRSVVADKGYLSNPIVTQIEDVGAKPYIPFKINSQGKGSPAWERMYHLWSLRREEFYDFYGARQNVESSFSALKRKFGPSIRSKGPRHTDKSQPPQPLPASMVNEILLKVLCFNTSMVVHTMYEMNLVPEFRLPSKE